VLSDVRPQNKCPAFRLVGIFDHDERVLIGHNSCEDFFANITEKTLPKARRRHPTSGRDLSREKLYIFIRYFKNTNKIPLYECPIRHRELGCMAVCKYARDLHYTTYRSEGQRSRWRGHAQLIISPIFSRSQWFIPFIIPDPMFSLVLFPFPLVIPISLRSHSRTASSIASDNRWPVNSTMRGIILL